MNLRSVVVFLLVLVTTWVAYPASRPQAQPQIEITFQSFEVDVGQDSDDAPILGNEWNAFGIDMVGTDLTIYTNHDPLPGSDNKNGVFHLSGSFWDIVFDAEVEQLQVMWWAPLGPATLTSFDVDDAQLESKSHAAGLYGVDTFSGTVKRLRVEAEPPNIGIGNLQFVPSNDVSVSSRTWSAIKSIYRE